MNLLKLVFIFLITSCKFKSCFSDLSLFPAGFTKKEIKHNMIDYSDKLKLFSQVIFIR